MSNHKAIRLRIILIVALTTNLLSCRNKIKAGTSQNDQLNDTVYVNAKNALDVKVKHGDSTNVTLKYGGPDVLLDINYHNGSVNPINISFGEYSTLYPEFILLSEIRHPDVKRSYYFNSQNGSISTIRTTVNNDFDGPCYLFNANGIMIVSGFYKKGYCAGIWRHYDATGNILETINADVYKIDLLKRFGVAL